MRLRLAVLLAVSAMVAGWVVPAMANVLPACATTTNNGFSASLVQDNNPACVVNYSTLTGDIVVMENFSNVQDPSTWSDLMHFDAATNSVTVYSDGEALAALLAGGFNFNSLTPNAAFIPESSIGDTFYSPTNTPIGVDPSVVTTMCTGGVGCVELVSDPANGNDTEIPEPGSLLLLGTGLCGLAGAIRRKLRG